MKKIVISTLILGMVCSQHMPQLILEKQKIAVQFSLPTSIFQSIQLINSVYTHTTQIISISWPYDKLARSSIKYTQFT